MVDVCRFGEGRLAYVFVLGILMEISQILIEYASAFTHLGAFQCRRLVTCCLDGVTSRFPAHPWAPPYILIRPLDECFDELSTD